LSSALSELGLGYLVNAIYTFTLDLMQEELLIRGAIAKGKLYHQKGDVWPGIYRGISN
jgi:hypothetical protein